MTRITMPATCPACGSGASKRTGPEAPGFSVLAGAAEYSQCEYLVLECAECGLLFRTPSPDEDVLQSYYSSVDFGKWETPGLYPTEEEALAVLRGVVPGGSLLDFGCSTGRLMGHLVKGYRCHGFEIDPRAARVAAARGLTMLEAGFLDEGPVELFHGIAVMDVFEHLRAPTSVLRRLAQALKPNGILVLATGNGDAPACRLDPAQFWYFRNIEHLVMLTRRHAGWLEREIGLTLVRWKRVCHYRHSLFEQAKQRIRHWAFWRFQRGPAPVRLVMQLVPLVRRARHWKVAPALSASRDHVVAVFKKASEVP